MLNVRFVFLFLISLFLITSDVLASGASTDSAAAGHDEAADGGGGDHAQMRAVVASCLGPEAVAGVLSPDQLAYAAAMRRKTEEEYADQVARAERVDFPRVLATVPHAEEFLARAVFTGRDGKMHTRGSVWYHRSLTGRPDELPQPMTVASTLVLDAAQLLCRCGSFGDPNELLRAPDGWVQDCRAHLGAANCYAMVSMSRGIDWFLASVAGGAQDLECGMFAKALRMLALRAQMGRDVFEVDAALREESFVTRAGMPPVPFKDWTNLRSLVGGVADDVVVTYETLSTDLRVSPATEQVAKLVTGDIVSIEGIPGHNVRHPQAPTSMINAVCVGVGLDGDRRFVTFLPDQPVRVMTVTEMQEMLLQGYIDGPSPYELELARAQPWRAAGMAATEALALPLASEFAAVSGIADRKAFLNRVCQVAAVYTTKPDLFDPRDPRGSVRVRASEMFTKYEAAVRAGAVRMTPAELAEELAFLRERRALLARLG